MRSYFSNVCSVPEAEILEYILNGGSVPKARVPGRKVNDCSFDTTAIYYIDCEWLLREIQVYCQLDYNFRRNKPVTKLIVGLPDGSENSKI